MQTEVRRRSDGGAESRERLTKVHMVEMAKDAGSRRNQSKFDRV